MDNFKNILADFKGKSNDFLWVSRPIKFTKSYEQNKPPASPSQLKTLVYTSENLEKFIEELNYDYAYKEKPRKHIIKSNILDILEEIGYEYDLSVIRWLGFILVKILRKSHSGLYVNDYQLTKIKNEMGSSPVIFLPTHRSYGDFIIMAFICFYYGISIPCVAAGMDFLSMRFMNRILRKSKAFFVRRKFVDDPLYKTIFKEYIKMLVTHVDSPVEFFIEGTRSRTNKSLMPKFGLISTLVEAYLSGDVPDLKIIPVSISYDRILEETLFAHELMGIPKPKESTLGLFKAVRFMKGNYGKIFVNFGEPLSIRTFFNETRDWRFCSDEYENLQLQHLAFSVVKMQQQLNIYGAFNLLALIINECVINTRCHHISLQEAITKFQNLLFLFEKVGATVYFEGDIEEAIRESISTHSTLVELSEENIIYFKSNIEENLLSGKSSCDSSTLSNYVPFMMLQLYVNPSINLFIRESIIIYILKKLNKLYNVSIDFLFEHYQCLCKILKHEFVLEVKYEEYHDCLSRLKQLELIRMDEPAIKLKCNDTMPFFISLLKPFIYGIYAFCLFLNEFQNEIRNKTRSDIIKMVQSYIERLLLTDGTPHQYCLSIDFISNTFHSLHGLGLLVTKGETDYTVNEEIQNSILDYLGNLVGNEGCINRHMATSKTKLPLYSKL